MISYFLKSDPLGLRYIVPIISTGRSTMGLLVRKQRVKNNAAIVESRTVHAQKADMGWLIYGA